VAPESVAVTFVLPSPAAPAAFALSAASLALTLSVGNFWLELLMSARFGSLPNWTLSAPSQALSW